MFKTIKRWLGHHKNHQIGTYMDRWYLIPPQWGLPISVRLQHLKRGDDARQPHNHPYAFKSIVLKGWYDEEQVMDFCELAPGHELMAFEINTVRHSRFKLFNIAQKRYHRIVAMPKSGVWTIIWHPRKPQQYEWGYLDVDGSHIPHAQYVRPAGYDLPYKDSAYRRDGPIGERGPGGPSSHVIDTTDTLDLLALIKIAAENTDSVGLQLHGTTTRCAGAVVPKLDGEVVYAAIYNPKAVQKGDRI